MNRIRREVFCYPQWDLWAPLLLDYGNRCTRQSLQGIFLGQLVWRYRAELAPKPTFHAGRLSLGYRK